MSSGEKVSVSTRPAKMGIVFVDFMHEATRDAFIDFTEDLFTLCIENH